MANNTLVPEAKAALEDFKMQAANEVGVTLNKNGYNGDLTARQAGQGGQGVQDGRPGHRGDTRDVPPHVPGEPDRRRAV